MPSNEFIVELIKLWKLLIGIIDVYTEKQNVIFDCGSMLRSAITDSSVVWFSSLMRKLIGVEITTRTKLDQLLEIGDLNNVQVIAIQETKLKKTAALKIRRYKIFRADRPSRGGGGA
ncbi:hypothetical protein TNCT_665961 [Trichonephila clavata]|uniref:Uncharacterized protein n=1 Tax=Trichonephila clavata TaxID=2740835 RepID=A0A8X6IBV2_TRICU|nr:hypothetical protein TNCT_665961 [Trichonephila clavata]